MKTFLFSVILLTGIFTNAGAQQKIGVVNVDEIYPAMPEALKVDSVLAMYQQSLQQNYKEQEDEIYAAIEKFTRDSASMTPSAKEVKRNDLESRIAELQKKQGSLEKTLQVKKEELQVPIREKLLKGIQDAASEGGFTMVIYKDQVIVMAPADDITPLVKRKLGIK